MCVSTAGGRDRSRVVVVEIALGDLEAEDPSRVQSEDLRSLAVVEVAGGSAAVNQMLLTSLSVQLAEKGLHLVERARIEEVLKELALQGSGLTAEDVAVDIGRLGNAHFLVLGELSSVGDTSTLSLRLVEVEAGTVDSTCEVVCRDCRLEDHLEALELLVGEWVQ